MSIEEYTPASTLVVPKTSVPSAKYPFMVHSHQNPHMTRAKLDELVASMDTLNLKVMVNLSGGFGEYLKRGAHLGWLGGDLESLGKILDTYPNVYTECGNSRVGRQPSWIKMIFRSKDLDGRMDEFPPIFVVQERFKQHCMYS